MHPHILNLSTLGTTAIDKDASSRFIKHAIAQAQSPGQAPKAAGPSHIRFNETIERVPVKVTSKMREREQYENELKESNAEDSEEEELEVFEDELSEQQSDGNGKGKAKAPSPSPPQLASDSSKTKKRRRPVADVFAGAFMEIRAIYLTPVLILLHRLWVGQRESDDQREFCGWHAVCWTCFVERQRKEEETQEGEGISSTILVQVSLHCLYCTYIRPALSYTS